MPKRRVLILAEQCNPDWPSLPIVGYKYARALAQVADVQVVTHVRNRNNIEAAGDLGAPVDYIDTEWLAAPMHRFATWVRGGDEVAWSTNMILSYPPYVAFEKQAWHRWKSEVKAGDFDLIHRITPMSPTLPSAMVGKGELPFVIGPLNGNLDWPAAFAGEQKREKEKARSLRDLYKFLPYARRTQKRADCLLAGFQHTIDDLGLADPARIIPFPEVGIDPEIFHANGRQAPFSGDCPFEFLFAGRLVPYKVPEAAVRAFVTSEKLRPHRMRIIGNGPEEARLRQIVVEHGAEDRVHFDGRKTQTEVAEAMRRADALVFPSIRELGAGVVVEAQACGALLIVTDYGAPGALVDHGRGVALPLSAMDGLVDSNRRAMEACIEAPEHHATLAAAGCEQAHTAYSWSAKAAYTARIYEAVLNGQPLTPFNDYA
ncbi:glycosyltransferase family 4 protein [Thalassobius sp. MITS945101]|uniref:glycosyltransferase family 4 protein n=1 Tax=Thalassobius sp. MITS945101 TaxID=3096994 RepID=UPI003999759C